MLCLSDRVLREGVSLNMAQAPPPVFIVGTPRSGTTMLAAMVGSHSIYASGPESQFFSKLSPQTLETAVLDPNWPAIAVEVLFDLTLAEQPVVELFGASTGEIYDFLSRREPSVAAMLEALTVPFAAKRGKAQWAEKTPNHMLSLPIIRQLWPDAAIVRIMRDPRDAALSTCKLPTFSDSFVANMVMWRAWHDQARPFFETDGNCYTLRYESLVENSARELSQLCEFLQIPFEAEMLEFATAASDVSSQNETWKNQVSGKLDPSRMFAWKRSLDTRKEQFAQNLAYEYLLDFDYQHGAAPQGSKAVYRLSSDFAELEEDALLNLSENGIRWLPTSDWKQADIVVEQPEYHRLCDPCFLLKFLWGRCQMYFLNWSAKA